MQKYIFISLILFIFSCGNTENVENNNQKIDSVEVNDEVEKNLKVNYEFIQGENIEESKKILIVVIDPHGDGKLAVSKFQKIIENFDCTVIGLNDVENNQQDFIQTIGEDIETAIVDLGLDVEQIYFAGFSGGAKMAFYYAYKNKANGVLMCGASVAEVWQNLPFPIAFIAGTQDMNLPSIAYSPYSDIATNMNFLSFIFEGKHEWPSDEYILKAFAYLFIKNNINISELEFDYVQENKKYSAQKKEYLAYKSLEACYKTYQDENLKLKIDKLLEKENFVNYMQNYYNNLNAGNLRNGDYLKDLPTKDFDWWEKEIVDIEKLSKDSDRLVADSYCRTKAYLGLVMFSYVSNEINNPNSLVIDKYLKIYELLEPENPDLLNFKAQRQKQIN